jgi:RNA polymerase sigma-70 factor (sigma-E family)
VQGRSEEWFASFVRERWTGMVRLAYTLTLDKGSAEDVAQESFAKLWSARSRVRDGDVDAYLRRIVVNQALTSRRRRWSQEHPTDDVPDLAISSETGLVDDRQALLAALAALSKRQRAVIVLRYAWDMSETQVAEALGCSVGTVKTQASRGLTRLRAQLSDAWYADAANGARASARRS